MKDIIINKEYTLGINRLFYNKSFNYENDITIITNNSKVKNKYKDCVKIEGEFIDVLNEVRDRVYLGYKLISYPLPASIRMIYSPVRTVLLSRDKSDIDEYSLTTIEESIEKYLKTMGERNVDIKNKNDYEIIDYDLTNSAIEENDFITLFKNF